MDPVLWSFRLSEWLESGLHIHIANNQQVSLLNNLKNQLNVNLFDTKLNIDEREVFKTIYVKDFLNKAKRLFTKKNKLSRSI